MVLQSAEQERSKGIGNCKGRACDVVRVFVLKFVVENSGLPVFQC